MLRSLLVIFLILIFGISEAQDFSEKTPYLPAKADITTDLPKNMAPSSARYLEPFLATYKKSGLPEGLALKTISNKTYISAFIEFYSKPDISGLASKGVVLHTINNKTATAHIPIAELENVLNQKNIKYLEVSRKANILLDSARIKSSVDSVHAGSGLSGSYSGKGVIVGIIDQGFDYTHPTFYDSAYNEYRVSRVWDQNIDGTTPAGFNYGNELVGKDEILAQANDGENQGSHGTHVAGIAAGSGGSLYAMFRGMAYQSEIVLVATTRLTTDIVNAVNYIFNYADQAGRPAVINISLGGHFGPHDGTSSFDQTIDELTGEGRIVVGSAGNDGSDTLHLDYTFTTKDTVYSFIDFSNNNINRSAGETYLNIWGEENKDFTFAVNIFNIETNRYEAYTEYISTSSDNAFNLTLVDDDDVASDNIPLFISVQHSYPNNNKPRVYIEFDNTVQDGGSDIYDYILLEFIGEDMKIDAWSGNDDGAIFSKLGYSSSEVIAGNVNSTVSEIGGTGKSIISVGAYTTKTRFTNIQGDSYSYPGLVSGEIASFSSLGPTADGRIKPDIAAPGNKVASSISAFDSDYSSASITAVGQISEGPDEWLFALKQGTSMSSPAAAGIIGLLLETNPKLTPDMIKQLFAQHSHISDETGILPNNTWGNGIINAYELIAALGDQEYEVTLMADPENGGSVEGGGFYSAGDTATVTAISADDYHFLYWTENEKVISEDSLFKFKVLSNSSLTAKFAMRTYKISATTNPENAGLVNGDREYARNDIAILSATPYNDYEFEGWTESDTLYSTESEISFTVKSARSFIASFKLKTYTIVATTLPEDAGSVTGTGEYEVGTTVELTVTPNEGYKFEYWTETGINISSDSIYTFSARSDRTLVANFDRKIYEITATVSPENSGTVTGAGTYEYGTTAELVAVPEEGYEFVLWNENDAEISNNDTLSFFVSEIRSLVAGFTEISGTGTRPEHEIKMYPNPVADYLFFQPRHEFAQKMIIKLYTIDGLLLKVAANENPFYIGNFPGGMYIVEISAGDSKTRKRIIIK